MKLKNSLGYFLQHIKDITGVEAVGIRLNNEGDYPYFVYNGYSNEFIKIENSLCSRDSYGKKILSPDGRTYELDCMCGNIIKGRFDPSFPFFTDGGSFFSNSTSHLLATTTEKERQGRTRNYCNIVGYESVAILPIRSRHNVVGVVHVADKRKNIFTEAGITRLEAISEDIAYEIKNNLQYIKIKDANEKIKRLNEKLEQMASTDTLTGLMNRRFFSSALLSEKNRFKRNKKPFTLIMTDIDYFKDINDASGHIFGDKVLIKVAKILQKSVREVDLVSRWGGDEFIILLPETSQDGGVALADKLRSIISSKPLKITNKVINLTMSFGVSQCSIDFNCEDCVKDADKYLLKAKRLGRNNVAFKVVPG
jgi:diguanylate cyclase (GGDEF)-like protein